MSAASEAAPAPSLLTGYIDAVTESRVFGWAWDARQPTARVAIRLIAGGETVAEGAADLRRDDLVANGVGDGAHAFELAVPPDVDPASLEVMALPPGGGAPVPLALPGAAGAAVLADSAELRQAMQALFQAQRATQRGMAELAKELAALRERDAAAEKAAQAEIAGRIDALEAAVLRIDGIVRDYGLRLAEGGSRPQGRAARAAMVAAALVLGVGIGVACTL